jgi:hypothetical protein
MNALIHQATYDRSARHVLRLRMRVPDSTARLRVQSMLEEALRLTTLPGEDQGRIYFFQRLHLPALDFRCSPAQWMARCSEHLLAASRSAKYVLDPGSGRAQAVYFHDRQQPRRLLLARLLAGDNAQEWYWPQATGVPFDLPPSLRVEHVLDAWRVQPAAWAAVGQELVPLLDTTAARSLLELIRPATAERWLAGLGRAGKPTQTERPIPKLRARTQKLLHDVSMHFAADDSRVVFFAVLAVLESFPTAAQDSVLPIIASSALEQPRAPVLSMRDVRGRLLHERRPRAVANAAGLEHPPASERLPQQIESSALANHDQPLAGITARAEHITNYAGLYFLLSPLRHLGIAEALGEYPQLVLTHFVSRVLLRLAMTAGIAEEDPIILPLLDDLSEQPGQPDDPVVVPGTLAALCRLHSSPQLSERLWKVAMQRWCRDHARMKLREIVARPGRIYTTSTTIDVTMPMSAVDLRIRRCGLDLDPGYVPWFGRVVHFHYHVEASS